MGTVTVVDNESITVTYISDKAQVSHIIHQPISGQPLRDALNAGTEYIARNGAYKWLSDDRKNGPLTDEDREWGFNDWNRRAIKSGWKYWALVVPTEVKDAASMAETIADLFEQGLRMMVFDNCEEAQEWLDRF